MSTGVRAQGCPSQRVPKGAAKGAKAFLKKHLCPSALETVPVEMHISMATMPAASLRLLLCSLCGDAMGRFASAMKVRGAAQPAAKAKAKVKKCSKPRCRNNAKRHAPASSSGASQPASSGSGARHASSSSDAQLSPGAVAQDKELQLSPGEC